MFGPWGLVSGNHVTNFNESVVVFSLFRSKKTVDELAQKSARRVEPPKAPAVPSRPETAEPAVDVSAPSAAEELDDLEFGPDLPMLEFGSDSQGAAEGVIEVVESTESVDPVVEQAAMLYASGQPRETIALLEDVLRSDPQTRIEIWFMLFELYALQATRNAFEDLAVKFAEKFKRSAPDWDHALSMKGVAPAVAPVDPAKAGTGYFAFTGVLSGESTARQLEPYAAIDAKGQPVRVEFSKVQDLDADAATLLRSWLVQKVKSRRQWMGLVALSEKLDPRYEVMRPNQEEMPFWLLQLDLLQMLGRQEEFENLAVDYAVTYEVSPPSWDARKVVSDVAESSPAAPAAPHKNAEKTDEDVFILKGVIADGQGEQLTALRTYANGRNHLHLDFQKVVRMDFSSAGWLLNMLIAFQQDGKTTIITGASELIIGLFRVLGITELAQVVRRR